jgi:hypothetical protein
LRDFITNNKRLVSQILCLIVFAITFAVRLDSVNKKEGLYCDEVISILAANYTDYGWKKFYDENVTYTGKQIKELTLWNKPSIADAFQDVKKLYVNNKDRPHTNLYYSCLRLWFAGVVTTDLRKIINRGCGLNLLFFAFSFFFMYKLLRRLFNDDWLIPFSLLVAFLNGGSISNAMFLRPYSLQETLLIAFTYSFVRRWEDLEKRKLLLSNLKAYCKFVPVAGLTLLSGYFAAIYVLILMGTLIYLSWKTRQKDNVKFVCVSLFSSFLFARALYNKFFCGFTCGRAGEAYKQFGDVIINNLITSSDAFFQILRDHCIAAPLLWLIFMIAIFFPHRKNETDKKVLTIFAACFTWSFGVMFLAPFKVLRYIMSCFPLMSLIVPYAIFNINVAFRGLATATISVCLIAAHLSGFTKVEHLFTGQSKQFEFFTKKPDVPVLVLAKRFWDCSYVLHHFSDAQTYEFPASKESFESKLNKYDSAIVLFSDEYSPQIIQSLIPKNFNAVSINKLDAFSGYELRKNAAIRSE